MTTAFGPQSTNASLTLPPSATNRYGDADTWFKDQTIPGRNDATVLDAQFLNNLLGNIRNFVRFANVTLDDGDMDMLRRAVVAAIQMTNIESSQISDATVVGRAFLTAASIAAQKSLLQIASTDIKDSTTPGRALLTATSVAAQLAALGAGLVNGLATLDSTGKVPVSQLPAAVLGALRYQGSWNASTNTPAIPVASSSNVGWYYIVGVAGSTSIVSSTGTNNSWKVGDWIVSDGSAWDKIDNGQLVTSVAGRTGAVVLSSTDLTDSTATGRSVLTAASTAAIKTLLAIASTDITDSTAVGRNLLTAASAAAGRSVLGAAASGANSDITSITGLTTALSATLGGTGQLTYAVGDILFASSTSALSRLAAAATGNVLISGSTPSWGKVALTAHVSGILPIANGGTNASDIATARSNLGLGSAAVLNAGSGANNVPQLDSSGNLSITGTIGSYGAAAGLVAADRSSSGYCQMVRGGGVNYLFDSTYGYTVSWDSTGIFRLLNAPASSDNSTAAVSSAWVKAQGYVTSTGTVTRSPIRQTVSSGPVSSGAPTFLPATASGLSITSQNITSGAPLIVSGAQGFNASGALDYISSITSNVTWSSLTASATNYLFINANTGALSSSTLAPIYQFGGTISTTNGQFTFDYEAMAGYLGNGSSVTATPLVCVGQAVTSSSAVTAAVAYAYNGYWETNFTTVPAANSAISYNSYLGCSGDVRLRCFATSIFSGYAVGEEISLFEYDANVGSYPVPVFGTSLAAEFLTSVGDGSFLYHSKSSNSWTEITTSTTTCTFKLSHKRSW